MRWHKFFSLKFLFKMSRKTVFLNYWSAKKYEILLFLFVFFTANGAIATATEKTMEVKNEATAGGLKGKLVFAHVIYRHGDRTPIDPYPTDPWKDIKDWPTGWGQLTNTGKLQHYGLGQWLRKRYNSILNDIYDKEQIYVRSTDVDRTLMSALSNLAGLYQPVQEDIWEPTIHWQPIPVHTQPKKTDVVLAAEAPCPTYDYALSALKDSVEFKALNDRYDYLYNYLSKYSGATVDSLEAVQRINNTFFIEELYNKTLPRWTKKIYPSRVMTDISAFTFTIATYTRQMARLKAGPLIKEMLERFLAKSTGKLNPDRSLWVYSGHDTTVANVLNSLKLYDTHSPPYIACVLLELRLDDKLQPYISVFYKNTTEEPSPLYIPDCGIACPLNKMFTLYNDILPKDWESECQLSTPKKTYVDPNLEFLGVLVIFIMVMVIVICYNVLCILTDYFRQR